MSTLDRDAPNLTDWYQQYLSVGSDYNIMAAYVRNLRLANGGMNITPLFFPQMRLELKIRGFDPDNLDVKLHPLEEYALQMMGC